MKRKERRKERKEERKKILFKKHVTDTLYVR
jgi:hypothetical protein